MGCGNRISRASTQSVPLLRRRAPLSDKFVGIEFPLRRLHNLIVRDNGVTMKVERSGKLITALHISCGRRIRSRLTLKLNSNTSCILVHGARQQCRLSRRILRWITSRRMQQISSAVALLRSCLATPKPAGREQCEFSFVRPTASALHISVQMP